MFVWQTFQTDVAAALDDVLAAWSFCLQEELDEVHYSVRRYRNGSLWIEISWESKEALLQIDAGYRYRVKDWSNTLVGPSINDWLRLLGHPQLPHEQRFEFRSAEGLEYRPYVLHVISTYFPDIVKAMQSDIDELDATWRNRFQPNFFVEKLC